MAKVSLRIYNQEIEGLVDSGQLDEAIAHCRHILNTYPKHLETYRMIGKAYLEAKRYEEATDIFERILMSVPDDFVAHVGMSIIRDEQKSMDAAIWYMQRAFEVQPSNAAIQAELQRLYGRRDGIEPPKIRLTRGALAHMYVQGELYAQAISEIKAVLEEDPERQDMQVLLARAYFHAGQQSEAAGMCSQLLRRYPYCFEANRVLVELLPQTERGENIQVYRNRVNELEPYAAFVTGSVFHTEEVSDAAVSLERLEWDGQPVDVRPEWSGSMGIGLGEKPAAGDAEPDWLRAGFTSESTDASGLDEEPAPTIDSLPTPTEGGSDEIPDFLREAGWGEDTGSFQEGLGSFEDSSESSEDVPLAEGDLPDWVKAMAPTGAAMADEVSQAEPEGDLTQDDVPDWLQGIGDAQSTPDAEESLAEAEVPDWLESMKPADEAAPPVQEQPQEQTMAEPTNDDDLPDWLKSIQPEDEEAAPSEPYQEPVQATSQEPVQESPEISETSLSDWQISDDSAADIDTLGASAEEQDDAVAWLESLASKHGAKPEELVTDPNDRSETAPDWVQKAQSMQRQAQADEPAPQEDVPVAEEPAQPVEQPAPPFAASVDDLGTSAEEQDDAIAWLESLASKHGAKPEELVTDPNARSEIAPEWVQKASEIGSENAIGERPTAPPAEEPAEDEPDWMKEAKEVGESLYAELEEAQTKEHLPSADTDETGMWLRDLGDEGGFAEEQSEQPAAEGDIPDWLSGLDEEEIKAEAAPEPKTTAKLDEEVVSEPPDWVREMETEASETEATSTSDDDASLPDWLRDMDEGPSEAESVPTSPSQGESPELQTEVGDKIDLNNASIEQLAALPGIGDLLAQNIVAHRETFGDFSNVEDLSNIAGIGPSTIDELRGQVEFGQPQPESEDASVTEWLRNLEDESPDEQVAETQAEDSGADDDLPSWLDGLEGEEETQHEAGSDADMPEWLRDEAVQEPVAEEPEPTAPMDWKPADAAEETPQVEAAVPTPPEPEPKVEEPTAQATPTAVTPEPEPTPEPPTREPYREPVTRSRTGMTGMLSSAQDPALTEAQNELTRGNIPGAMENYSKLIKKGKLLEEIIFDLREALYRYPVEIAILQTLGDAYMRANRIQEALDSYTKAEELLR